MAELSAKPLVASMCTLCCADRHEAPSAGCPGANATGPQRILWNWNAKYRKSSRTVTLSIPRAAITLYDADMNRIGTVAEYEAVTGVKVILGSDAP